MEAEIKCCCWCRKTDSRKALPLGVGTACRKFNPVWFCESNSNGWKDSKGTYGDALFYFGGEENYLGQAHSVNKSYNRYVNAGGITRTFSRNNAVYNEEGKKHIGWEYFTDSLKFSFSLFS